VVFLPVLFIRSSSEAYGPSPPLAGRLNSSDVRFHSLPVVFFLFFEPAGEAVAVSFPFVTILVSFSLSPIPFFVSRDQTTLLKKNPLDIF